MNYKLRLLTFVFIPLLGYACSIKAQSLGDLWSQPKKNLFIANASTEGLRTKNFRLENRRSENTGLETEQALTGDRLLSEVRIRLQQRPYFQTRIQQQINYGKHKFLGVGHYYQQGQERDRHVRFELQTKVGSTSGTLLQVSNGRIQWQDTTLPSKRTVTRLDLRRVRAIEKQTQKELRLAPGSASSHLVQLNRSVQAGGIPALLKSLSENFTFSTPYHLQYENQPMYGIVGTWRVERLAVLLQGADHLTRQEAVNQELVKQLNETVGPQEKEGFVGEPHASQEVTKEENPKSLAELLLALPAQMPTDVLLLIGQQDLFPYDRQYHDSLSATIKLIGLYSP